MKKNIMVMAVLCGVSGCSTVYTDSANTADGGVYVSGQRDGQKAMYYCPKDLNKVNCEKVKITVK